MTERVFVKAKAANIIKVIDLLTERKDPDPYGSLSEEIGVSKTTLQVAYREQKCAKPHDVAAEAILRRMGKSNQLINKVLAVAIPSKHQETVNMIIGNLGGRVIDALDEFTKKKGENDKISLVVVNGENVVGIEALIKGVEGKSTVIE